MIFNFQLNEVIKMTQSQPKREQNNFANNPERAAEAGRKGGQVSGGNFKNDPQRAAAAGHKGGQVSGGNFKNNPARAAEAGRKGGQNSHKRSQQQ
jgi:general stress protein YciG